MHGHGYRTADPLRTRMHHSIRHIRCIVTFIGTGSTLMRGMISHTGATFLAALLIFVMGTASSSSAVTFPLSAAQARAAVVFGQSHSPDQIATSSTWQTNAENETGFGFTPRCILMTPYALLALAVSEKHISYERRPSANRTKRETRVYAHRRHEPLRSVARR